jgi:ectoine hydroxylase-related dioxygenase (phytanoyl-CoA dioxygenase family)
MTDNGYAIHPALFAPAEIQDLGETLARAPLQRSRAGARHVLGREDIAMLALDPRLIDLATQWLGAPALPFKATLFEKTSSANWLVAWHQDTAVPMAQRSDCVGWGPWSEKFGVLYAHAPACVLERIVALRVHLDDSTADNGPLRVLPRTHTFGVLSDAQVHEHSRHVDPVECRVAAGGVLVMRPLLIHAWSKMISGAARRVIHFEYAASLEPAPGLRLRAA